MNKTERKFCLNCCQDTWHKIDIVRIKQVDTDGNPAGKDLEVEAWRCTKCGLRAVASGH